MKEMTANSKTGCLRRAVRSAALCLLGCLTLLPARLTAEDSDELRWYMMIRRGEFNQAWGPQDMSGVSLGLNFNRYLGLELAVDQWQELLDDPVLGGATLGEEFALSFTPQLRLRYPLFHDRLVPYIVAGFGGSFHQFNDPKSAGFGRNIDAEDYGWAATVGAGVDFFVADNIALNLEVKQIWHSSLDVTVDDHTFTYNPSDWIATIGFRVFLQENNPRPLVKGPEGYPTRIYLGFHAGMSLITDANWSGGVKWTPEACAWGDTFIRHFGGRLGIDFGRCWGVELVAEGDQPNARIDGVGTVCDYALATFIPQVRLRLPVSEGRWVPYFMAGAGLSYGEANDYKHASESVEFKAKGLYFPAFSVGGGVEYFIARNLSLSAESRWTYAGGHEYTLNGQKARGDFSQMQFMLALRLYLIEF